MKKVFYCFICFLLFFTLGCDNSSKNGDKSDIELFIEDVIASEQSLTGYKKESSIVDGDLELYYESIDFKVERGDILKTAVSQTTKTINTNVNNPGITYIETSTEYITEDDKKYENINGNEVTTAYDIPQYFLDFVIVEEYLEDGYELTKTSLKASIKSDKINDFFLGKSLSGVKDLRIELVIEDSRLINYKAVYSTSNDFTVEINVSYDYLPVSISR